MSLQEVSPEIARLVKEEEERQKKIREKEERKRLEEERRLKKAEEEREIQARERTRTEKLRKIMHVSEELSVERMAKSLDMEVETLWDKLFDWASEFGFKIKGETVVFSGGNVDGFIGALDKQFTEWADAEETGKGKKI